MNPTIDRRCHWLGRNRASKRPGLVLFFDTEANRDRPREREEDHTYRLGVGCLCAYDPDRGLLEQEWRDLPTPDLLWGWVEEIAAAGENLYVVSHNIDYDARLSRAFYYLPRLGWSPTWCVMARSCSIFAWGRKKQKLILLDNLNLMPVSLAVLGESLGVPKGEVDFDAVSDADLLAYCRQDVNILVRAWERWLQFIDDHDLGNFGITIAKQAFNAYRHKFMPVKIGIHNNKLAMDLEREAYRGARCECFFVGKPSPGEYYKLDVNGLYAAMMSWYSYPHKLIKVVSNVRADYLNHLLRDHLAIARVCLQVQDPKYPIRIRDRNVYPKGAFFTTLTTPELQIALDAGEVVGVGEVALYEPADLFSGYIAEFHSRKQEYLQAGDLARSQMCKLLQNSLQGKFGQKGHHQEVIADAPIDKVACRYYTDLETGRTCSEWTFGGKIIRQYDEGEPYDSLPAIPAHVAAYGRMYLWSLIEMAGRCNVLYSDTDSLLVNQAGYERLAGMVDPLKLGYLKVEGVASDVEIRAAKDYTFDGHAHTKGIKKTAELIAENHYQQWHFTTMRYAFQQHNLEGVTLRRVEKRLTRAIAGGTVGRDGWVTPPRLHLTPQEIQKSLSSGETSSRWVWEFDQSWLSRLARAESLGWRLARSLGWAESPLGLAQPDALPFGQLPVSQRS